MNLKVGTCDFDFGRFQIHVLYTGHKTNIENGKDFWDTPYLPLKILQGV